MITLKVPASIQAQIALETADPFKIYQEEFPFQKLKKNDWNRINHCVLHCGQPFGKSKVHTGTGAFVTKCCANEGNDVIEFFKAKFNVSTQKAAEIVEDRSDISVREMPKKIRESDFLVFSQTLSTVDGEVVQLLGRYNSGRTLVFKSDKDISDVDYLRVQRISYETCVICGEDEFYTIRGEESFLPELIANASSNGLVKSGAVINVNDFLFIDEGKFETWFSALAKRGCHV